MRKKCVNISSHWSYAPTMALERSKIRRRKFSYYRTINDLVNRLIDDPNALITKGRMFAENVRSMKNIRQ